MPGHRDWSRQRSPIRQTVHSGPPQSAMLPETSGALGITKTPVFAAFHNPAALEKFHAPIKCRLEWEPNRGAEKVISSTSIHLRSM